MSVKSTNDVRYTEELRCPHCQHPVVDQISPCTHCGQPVNRPVPTDEPEKHLSARYRVTSLLYRRQGLQLQLAFDTKKNRPVLLRDLDIRSLSRELQVQAVAALEEEYALLRQSRFPGSLRLTSRFSDDQHLVSVSDWPFPISGHGNQPIFTLENLLQSGIGRPHEEVAIAWTKSLCLTVSQLHEYGFLLGDLHPQTIVVNSPHYEGQPLLTVSWLSPNLRLLLHSALNHLNSTFFSAPELSELPLSPVADIYSLGALLYLLLTGTSPVYQQQKKHLLLRSPRQLNPQISPAITDVTLRALSLNPDDRYQNATELVGALHQAAITPRASRSARAFATSWLSFARSGEEVALALKESPWLSALTQRPETRGSMQENFQKQQALTLPDTPPALTNEKILPNTEPSMAITEIPSPDQVVPPTSETLIPTPEESVTANTLTEVDSPEQITPSPSETISPIAESSEIQSPEQAISSISETISPTPEEPVTVNALTEVDSPELVISSISEMITPTSEESVTVNTLTEVDSPEMVTPPINEPLAPIPEAPVSPTTSDMLAPEVEETIPAAISAPKDTSRALIVRHPIEKPALIDNVQDTIKPLLKRLRRFLLGANQFQTTAAALIETPLRVRPEQTYFVRIHLFGRHYPQKNGGLSRLIKGDKVRLVIHSTLQNAVPMKIRQADFEMPDEGYVSEISLPLIPLETGVTGRRERIQLFFTDQDDNPLYERPFILEIFVSPLVHSGQEGHNVLTLPL